MANRRWELTPLGRQVNAATREFLKTLTQTLNQREISGSATEPYLSKNALLMVINAQNGLLDPTLGKRNNSEAETNIAKLLGRWRNVDRPILHVRHVSLNPQSRFFKDAQGSEFLPLLSPENGEKVIDKTKSSAFAGTELNRYLDTEGIDTVVLVGFTANECVDATARNASDLGLATYVVGDATAMFDISDTEGKLIKADRLHHLTLANLNALFAKVIETEQLLK